MTANVYTRMLDMTKGVKAEFNKDQCLMWMGDRIILQGHQRGGTSTLDVIKNLALMGKAKETAELWHRRLGHAGYGALEMAAKLNCVQGINLQPQDIKGESQRTCEPCILAKKTRSNFPTSLTRSTSPLELVSSDVCGPMVVQSDNGAKYFMTMLDDFSKMSSVSVIKVKSEVSIMAKPTIELLKRQCGLKVKRFRSDNGGEYQSQDLQRWLQEKGIFI